MNQQTILWKHTCEKCEHKWITIKEMHGNCTGCNSSYWNHTRKE